VPPISLWPKLVTGAEPVAAGSKGALAPDNLGILHFSLTENSHP
jgi:hypothetical protein